MMRCYQLHIIMEWLRRMNRIEQKQITSPSILASRKKFNLAYSYPLTSPVQRAQEFNRKLRLNEVRVSQREDAWKKIDYCT